MEPSIKKIRLARPYLVNPESKEAFGFYEVMVSWPDGKRHSFPSMEHAQAHIENRKFEENNLSKEVPSGFYEALNNQPRTSIEPTKEESSEPDSYEVFLVAIGSSKISLIKELRARIGQGLKECKALVESAPITIRENLSKDEAEQLKEALTAAGGTVEVK